MKQILFVELDLTRKMPSPWKTEKLRMRKFMVFLNIGGVFDKLVNEFLYNVKIKDQASMYKVFDKKILNGIHLEAIILKLKLNYYVNYLKKKFFHCKYQLIIRPEVKLGQKNKFLKMVLVLSKY